MLCLYNLHQFPATVSLSKGSGTIGEQITCQHNKTRLSQRFVFHRLEANLEQGGGSQELCQRCILVQIDLY